MKKYFESKKTGEIAELLNIDSEGKYELKFLESGKVKKYAQSTMKRWYKLVTNPQVEQIEIEPEKVEPKKVEPKKVEPEKVEPEKVEPKKVEPEKVEPKKVEKLNKFFKNKPHAKDLYDELLKVIQPLNYDMVRVTNIYISIVKNNKILCEIYPQKSGLKIGVRKDKITPGDDVKTFTRQGWSIDAHFKMTSIDEVHEKCKYIFEADKNMNK